jgi:ATP-binding cassette subfamily F protein uup
MANLVNTEGLGRTHGTTVVLRDVSLGIADGERVGVVGRNGGGKSTLLRLLAGVDEPDTGRVTHVSDLTVGLLAQRDPMPAGATVLDVVVGGRPEHEWAGDARVREVLAGLLDDVERGRPVTELSGGERRRVMLAALLVRDPRLLLLDEPTNHLDLEAIAWLAGWLRRRKGALVVVTHDRWFLDEVCESTWEVAGGSVHRYDGGYAAYVLARAERERQAAAAEDRRRNLLRKELAWLRRGPPARTSKPQFRIDAANALIADEPPPRDAVELHRVAAARLGKDVYDLENVSFEVAGRRVLDDVTWRVGPGDRIGLLGPNGAGKTSLLRLLAGQAQPTSGQLRTGATVAAAYLSQDVTELDPTQRVLEAVEAVAQRVTVGRGRELTASQLVERLGFPAARQWTPVGDLSGGERRRLQMLRLLVSGANVLLLDEPTNDLDVDTLAEVEDVLDGWAGSLIVVSHDRWFLERTCDDLWALPGNGTVRHLPGGVDDYLALRARAVSAPSTTSGAKGGGDSRADARARRRELTRIERRLDSIVQEEKALHEQIAAVATEHEKVLELDTALRALAAERAELEEAWLELADD